MLNTLPPLNSLKAFEAAAAPAALLLAADELAASPLPPSASWCASWKRYLGKTLFPRFNNRIVLTDAGQAICVGVTPALEDIAELPPACPRSSRAASSRVSVVASLAECWFLAGPCRLPRRASCALIFASRKSRWTARTAGSMCASAMARLA